MKKVLMSLVLTVVFMGGVASEGFADIAREMDVMVVTASRLKQKNYKIAGNVSVITREDIENSNAQTVPDILEEALGVLIYNKEKVTRRGKAIPLNGLNPDYSRSISLTKKVKK